MPLAREANAFGGAKTLHQFLRLGFDRHGGGRGVDTGGADWDRGAKCGRGRWRCTMGRAGDSMNIIIGERENFMMERLESNTEQQGGGDSDTIAEASARVPDRGMTRPV